MLAVVVGGGFAGLGIADALAWHGWAVTCLDREAVPGLGCSQASLGLVFPSDPSTSPGPLVELTRNSFRNIQPYLSGVSERSGCAISVGGSGLLQAAGDEQELRALERTADEYRAIGVPADFLDASQVADIEPALMKSAGAIVFADAQYVDAPPLLAALAGSIARAGGAVRTHAEAGSLLIEGGRCKGVRLADGSVMEADITIICSGASSWGLYPRLEGALSASRGQWLLVRTSKPLLQRAAYIGELDVIPRPDGMTMLGATQEGPGNRVPTLQGIASLLDQFRIHFNVGDDIEFVRANVGLRARTVDGLPIIGPSSVYVGLYLCVGLFKNGATLTPTLGSDFLRCLSNGDWSSLASFSPGRADV